MSPNKRHIKKINLKKTKAFSLFLSLFIIVILGLLATTLLKMTQYGSITVAHEVLGLRAFLAAESGANALAMELFPLSGSPSCSSRTISFSQKGLVGCSAIINCNLIVVDSENYYKVTSQGRCAVNGNLETSRTLELMLKDI